MADAIGKLPVTDVYRALDDELVKVGRGCVSAKALYLCDNFHHQMVKRRRCGMVVAYQVDEAEVATPTRDTASTADHLWRYLPAYGCRWMRIHVLTLGGTYSTTATDQARLVGSTTTDAGGDFAECAYADAPTATLATRSLGLYAKQLQVSPISALETVTVSQGGDVARTQVRILSVAVEDLPDPTIDPGVDLWAQDPAKWVSGTDIIDTEYDDIPLACTHTLRRYHKKVLWYCGKEIRATNTAFVDLVAGRDGAGGILRYDIESSVNRPQTPYIAVTVRVFAEDSVALNGTVRFAFQFGNIDVPNITNGGPAWYTATGTIAKPGQLAAPLNETGLPPWLAFSRAAGNNSYQTAAAVNGTTFISLNAAVNVPRFHYVPALARRCLLVEPARTNLVFNSNFVDVAPADNIPDGWTTTAGAAGVDFTTAAGAPHGGTKLQLLATATAFRGVFDANTTAALTQYTGSAWVRHLGAGADLLISHNLIPGFASIATGAAAHDWENRYVTATTVGGGAPIFAGMTANNSPAAAIDVALPQLEAAATRSTWIPTLGGTATRAAERCLISTAIMPTASGDVTFRWIPEFASTEAYGTPQLLSWNATTYIEVTAAQTIRIVNAGVARATSAVLAWSAWDVMLVRLQFGAGGTTITVNGTAVTDVNAWVAPALANPALGTDSAGTNCSPAAYADIDLGVTAPAETLSYQGMNTAAGTLTVYSAVVYEDTEAA